MGRLFEHPKENKEALAIWFDCCLSSVEEEEDIEEELWSWGQKNGALYQNTNGIYCISWKSNSGVSYFFTWPTFVKWFLCTCTQRVNQGGGHITVENYLEQQAMFQRIVELGI